jgi:hemoglobin-like flavoprotein
MTPEQIALVQSSFASVGERLPDMGARFYRELFTRDPDLRALFSTDLAEQQVRFVEKLAEIVRAIPRLDELLLSTRDLGANHAGYGVRVADYATVGTVLLDTFAIVLGDEFDGPTRQAWALAYNLVAEIMLEGAASAQGRRPAG